MVLFVGTASSYKRTAHTAVHVLHALPCGWVNMMTFSSRSSPGGGVSITLSSHNSSTTTEQSSSSTLPRSRRVQLVELGTAAPCTTSGDRLTVSMWSCLEPRVAGLLGGEVAIREVEERLCRDGLAPFAQQSAALAWQPWWSYLLRQVNKTLRTATTE